MVQCVGDWINPEHHFLTVFFSCFSHVHEFSLGSSVSIHFSKNPVQQYIFIVEKNLDKTFNR